MTGDDMVAMGRVARDLGREIGRAEGREEMRAAVLVLLEEMGKNSMKTLSAESYYFAAKRVKGLP